MTKEQLESLTSSERLERMRRPMALSAIQRKAIGHVVPGQPYFVARMW